MRYLFRIFAAVIVATQLGACAPTPNPNLSPSGVVAARADVFVKALGLIEDATIVLADQHVVSDADARIVITFVVDAAKTSKATPSGYVATIRAGIAATAASLSTDGRSRLGPYFTTLSLALDALGGR